MKSCDTSMKWTPILVRNIPPAMQQLKLRANKLLVDIYVRECPLLALSMRNTFAINAVLIKNSSVRFFAELYTEFDRMTGFDDILDPFEKVMGRLTSSKKQLSGPKSVSEMRVHTSMVNHELPDASDGMHDYKMKKLTTGTTNNKAPQKKSMVF